MDVQIQSPQWPARRRVRPVPIMVLLVAGVLLGLALTLQVETWSALGTEAGGSCGSSHGISYGPCPRGIGWMLPVSLIALFILVPATLVSAARAFPRRIGCLAAIPLLVLGLLPGRAIFNWGHGRTFKTMWTASSEHPSTEEGLGSWLSGGTVIRARFDRLVAYDVTTGTVRWTFMLPGRDVLCAMSRTVSDGIGLIAHGGDSAPCDRVTAVDLRSGRSLWQRNVPGGGSSIAVVSDALAVTGDTAILRNPRGLEAVGLRDGARRWEQKADDRCTIGDVAADGGQVLAVVGCLDAVPQIRTLDASTGRAQWTAKAPIEGTIANITLLSVRPAVVHIMESGQRGDDIIVAFDRAGRAAPAIQVEDGQRRLDVGDQGFRATPVRLLAIQDGMLVTKARLDNGGERLMAYDLTDGRLRWNSAESDFAGMAVRNGQATLVGTGFRTSGVWTVSLRDGRTKYAGVTDLSGLTSHMMLYPTDDGYVVVVDRAFNAAPVGAFRNS